ncbi:hypothetical protein DYH09_29905 [bacterium CPR1]|nr:hypothetical protein [bacterium CPR1]
MALGGAVLQQLKASGITPPSSRQTTPTTNRDNETKRGGDAKEGEEADSSFGALFNDTNKPVGERPEQRQQKLREQRIQTPRSETAASQDAQARATRTAEESTQPEGTAKFAKEQKFARAWSQDTRWMTQTKFDSSQASQPRLSDLGQRRMQAFYLTQLVNDNYQQHTGGKADEAYSRAQYRQILGALSSLGASTTKTTRSTNDGSRSGEPNTAASLGRKMGDANRVQQIFAPPPPTPADYEPLELVA